MRLCTATATCCLQTCTACLLLLLTLVPPFLPRPAPAPPVPACSSHSPCCHGRVICFSVYAGPEVHFGQEAPAEGAPRRSMLWVDTWLNGDEARQGEAAAIAEAFRPFWESAQHKKVGALRRAGQQSGGG